MRLFGGPLPVVHNILRTRYRFTVSTIGHLQAHYKGDSVRLSNNEGLDNKRIWTVCGLS